MIIPRPYQEDATYSIFTFFGKKPTGNPLISMPTGTGKAVVISNFLRMVLYYYPKQRIIQAVHTKELVKQNHDKFVDMWGGPAPAGIYCAGLNEKDTISPIIFASFASMLKNIDAFGHRDLLIIDESHCVSPNEHSGYMKIINRLTEINPALRVIGFSATNFRMGQGLLTDDGIFTDVCYDLTSVDEFNRLIAQGYLCPLVAQPTSIEIDTSDIKIVNGDYGKRQSDEAADKIMYEALKESVERGYDQQSWLVFCAGIKSSEHAAEILNSFGISSAAVHSKLPDKVRDKYIADYKLGKIKALCGMGLFTTGFDHPPADFCIMLRPTVSPGLHVQMLGRLTRPYDGSDPNFPNVKKYGLVLDFAGNCKRNGPINDPRIPRKKGKGTGEVPIKICEECGTYNHAAARFCCNPDCNVEFKFQTKLTNVAYTGAIIKSEAPILETFDVSKVIYHRHDKVGSMPTIKVSYFSGLKRFTEYVCLEHKGFARRKAESWWKQRHNSEPPKTTDEALSIITMLRTPKRIRVWTNKKYAEIMQVEW
jgi:DNA repair protein RadD